MRLAGLPLQTLATKKDKHENFNIYESNKTSHVIVNLLVWMQIAIHAQVAVSGSSVKERCMECDAENSQASRLGDLRH